MSSVPESEPREQRSYSAGARLSLRSFFKDGNTKQSRRTSQGIIKVPSTEFAWKRGRSKSVDLSLSSTPETQPEQRIKSTTLYTVADTDTLTSVAARFDTTLSELTKLNRLSTPFIFTGQQLVVPLTETNEIRSEGSTPVEDIHDDLPFEEKELLDNLRPCSPKPGHVEMVRTPSYNRELSIEHGEQELTSVFRESRFLKINVRHITDGEGVVGGVLLVTPNAVMFDPNVSDPLVIEKGPEAYGVIAPMEFVVNIAIYYDIAHMRVSHMESNVSEKAEIYHPAGEKESKSMLVKDETFSESVTGIDDADSVCSYTEREGDAFPKAFERDLVTPTNVDVPEQDQRTLEERRKSLLDHHWPMTSRDRQSIDVDEMPTISTPTPVCKANIEEEPLKIEDILKENCQDSGIDILEPDLRPAEHYSDADIVLSKKWVPPVTIAPPSHHLLGADIESPARKKASSVSFSLDSSSELAGLTDSKDNDSEAKKNKLLKRLSYPLSLMESLGGEKVEDDSMSDHSSQTSMDVQHPSAFLRRSSVGAAFIRPPNEHSFKTKDPSFMAEPSSVFSKVFSRRSSLGTFMRPPADINFKQKKDQHASVFSKVFSRRSSIGTFLRPPAETAFKKKDPPPRLDYRSMVSVEEKPDLFASLDKLIPRPARSCEDPPLYLRLKMGKPLDKKIPHSTPLISYGKKKMLPEYWFSVPKNRVDELYEFLQAWFPHLYGELDEVKIKENNFRLVDVETELWSEEPTPSVSRHGSKGEELMEDFAKESWEVLPTSEEYRRAFYSSTSKTPSLDIDLSPPELIGKTEILTDTHRESLCRHLPARAEGYAWTLVFSTSQHGFSLNNMYRKMIKLESPILLVIEDTDNNVFGALTSCALHVSDHFYGTGESLLFRFEPHFQVYNWTGENLYFIKGNNDSLSIGAGDGKFGLWLDGDLYLGRSESCKTYGNDPLTPQVDFVVKTLECWAFISF